MLSCLPLWSPHICVKCRSERRYPACHTVVGRKSVCYGMRPWPQTATSPARLQLGTYAACNVPSVTLKKVRKVFDSDSKILFLQSQIHTLQWHHKYTYWHTVHCIKAWSHANTGFSISPSLSPPNQMHVCDSAIWTDPSSATGWCVTKLQKSQKLQKENC